MRSFSCEVAFWFICSTSARALSHFAVFSYAFRRQLYTKVFGLMFFSAIEKNTSDSQVSRRPSLANFDRSNVYCFGVDAAASRFISYGVRRRFQRLVASASSTNLGVLPLVIPLGLLTPKSFMTTSFDGLRLRTSIPLRVPPLVSVRLLTICCLRLSTCTRTRPSGLIPRTFPVSPLNRLKRFSRSKRTVPPGVKSASALSFSVGSFASTSCLWPLSTSLSKCAADFNCLARRLPEARSSSCSPSDRASRTFSNRRYSSSFESTLFTGSTTSEFLLLPDIVLNLCSSLFSK
mmetsp:Transcript_19513/g.47653  ORF Transcript_19513/g.47653 Transcript_19513/m.47653 type:complete len:291 (-) Transcript_19513:281-1153(-)